MVNFKTGITAAALALGGLRSESAMANQQGSAAEVKQPTAAVSAPANSDWLSWATGGVAVISALGAAAFVVREELRKNTLSNAPQVPDHQDPEHRIAEGVAFVQSLLNIIPHGSDGDEMRNALEIKKLQLEGGWVTWDWRPGVKMYVECLLPEDSASMTPWQREIHSRISPLPERPEYGFPTV